MDASLQASRISPAQAHRCQLPDVSADAVPFARGACCGTCGQGYRRTVQHLNGYPVSSWTRDNRLTSWLLSEAWALERLARELPRWRLIQRWQLVRFVARNRRAVRAMGER